MTPTTKILNVVEHERKIDPLLSGGTVFTQEIHVKKWYSGLMTWKFIALTLIFCLVNVTIVNVMLISSNMRLSEISSTTVSPKIVNTSTDNPTGLIPINSDSAVLKIDIPDIAIDDDAATTELRFISREEWGAQPSTGILGKLELPVPYVIISHTATDFCRTQSECTFRVRFAQTFHIESRNWSDIAYSFLVGGDGYVYVGRGWDSVGAHSYGYNTKSIGISLIGTFNSVAPPKSQLIATQQLIDYGIKMGKISPNYKLLGHRQVSRTLSPGNVLFNVITEWSHWSSKP